MLAPCAFETPFLCGRRRKLTTLDLKNKILHFFLQLKCHSGIFPISSPGGAACPSLLGLFLPFPRALQEVSSPTISIERSAKYLAFYLHLCSKTSESYHTDQTTKLCLRVMKKREVPEEVFVKRQ